MQLSQGTSVFTADGNEAGRIDRVVIDPKTNEVSHIVIRKGFLIMEDKVVPMDLIAAGQEAQITLRVDKKALEQLPNFQETHYVVTNEAELGRDNHAPTDLAPGLYWYPPFPGAPTLTHSEPPYVAETRVNIPEGSIAVQEGAKVITRDDKHIGHVEQVLTRHQDDRVTHFVISNGWLLKERKLIPVEWIDSMWEQELRLAIGSRTVEALPNYEHV